MNTAYFSEGSFQFLRELSANNEREWFQDNKRRYEQEVKEPALEFIRAFAAPLGRISKHFRADDRPVGGSLFRIHRDTRFSPDKTPYKTHAGIHFRHGRAKSAHAPGFYLHLEPGKSFIGVGIWRPEGAALMQIRRRVVSHSKEWKAAVTGAPFKRIFRTLAGESLKRPPRGFDPEHPLIDDLRRKDFVAIAELRNGDVVSKGLLKHFEETCRAGAPLTAFLCRSLDLPF